MSDGQIGSGMRGRRRRRRLGIAALAVPLAAALALAILWPMRVGLARDYIDAELAKRGVRASYEVAKIGFGAQVFEHIMVGDPDHPDLVADHVEVEIALGLTGPHIGLISARGVRVNGRIEDGRLKLGELDKLIGPSAGEPFRLPDRRIDVHDAALNLATPAGDLVVAFAGQGNLLDGFRGGLALVAHELRFGDCVLSGSVARLGLRIEGARPRVHGPAAIARATCGGFVADRPLFAVNALLSQGLDQWRGTAATRIASAKADGRSLAAIQAHFRLEGDGACTIGSLALASERAAAPLPVPGATLASLDSIPTEEGETRVGGKLGPLDMILEGADSYAAVLSGARGTPLGPAMSAGKPIAGAAVARRACVPGWSR
jgi:hypothetical protein